MPIDVDSLSDSAGGSKEFELPFCSSRASLHEGLRCSPIVRIHGRCRSKEADANLLSGPGKGLRNRKARNAELPWFSAS